MKTKLSVITPVYNCETYIRQCIESVISQNDVDLEHIIVDDGSSDGTAKVISEYSHIKYIKQNNAGANVARNRGISVARGRYIKFLDADDFLSQSSLAKQIAFGNSLGETYIGYGYSTAIDRNGLERVSKYSQKPRSSPEDLILDNIATSLPLYPLSALKEVKGFNELLHARQEWDLHLRLSSAGYKFVFDNTLVYKQRLHDAPNRISNRRFDLKTELESLELIYASLPEPKGKSFNDKWAAYLWRLGRALIYNSQLQEATLIFNEARKYSSRDFTKYFGWKYKACRRILGDTAPDLIAKTLFKCTK